MIFHVKLDCRQFGLRRLKSGIGTHQSHRTFWIARYAIYPRDIDIDDCIIILFCSLQRHIPILINCAWPSATTDKIGNVSKTAVFA